MNLRWSLWATDVAFSRYATFAVLRNHGRRQVACAGKSKYFCDTPVISLRRLYPEVPSVSGMQAAIRVKTDFSIWLRKESVMTPSPGSGA